MNYENIFGADVNIEAMHQVVKMYLANQRQELSQPSQRAEVEAEESSLETERTGRETRSIRAPQWKKGGVVFAPKPRSYRYTALRR